MRRDSDTPIVPAHVLPPNVVLVRATGRYAVVRRPAGGWDLLGSYDTPEAAWAARQSAGFGPARDPATRRRSVTGGPARDPATRRRSVTGGPGPLPELPVTARDRLRGGDLVGLRQRLAAHLASHGPTPGDVLAAAVGAGEDEFWDAVDYGHWFEFAPAGWVLTATGKAELEAGVAPFGGGRRPGTLCNVRAAV
jgi:hypothetical protein